MRVLRLAKKSGIKARTQEKSQFRAVLLGIKSALCEALSKLTDTAPIARRAKLPAAGDAAVFPLRRARRA